MKNYEINFYERFMTAFVGRKVVLTEIVDPSVVAYTICDNDETAKIYISTVNDLFQNTKPALRDLVVMGVLVHETLHQLFTDSELLFKALEAEKDLVRFVNLAKTMFNIFEDSRIEYYADYIYGGLGLEALECAKRVTFMQSPEIKPDESLLQQVMNGLIQVGDANEFKGEMSKEAYDIFKKIMPLFEKAYLSPKTEICVDASIEAARLLWDAIPEESKSSISPDEVMVSSGAKGAGSGKAIEIKPEDLPEELRDFLEELAEKMGEESDGGDGSGIPMPSCGASDPKGSSGCGEKSGDDSKDTSDGESKEGSGSCGGSSDDKYTGKTSDGDIKEADDKDGKGAGGSKGSKSSKGKKGAKGTDAEGKEGHDGAKKGSSEKDKKVKEKEILDDYKAAAATLKESLEKEKSEESKRKEEDKSESFDLFEPSKSYPHCSGIQQLRMTSSAACVREYEKLVDKNSKQISSLSRSLERIIKTEGAYRHKDKKGKVNIERYIDPSYTGTLVFDKITPNQDLDCCIILAVDESGSMRLDNRYIKAKEAAIIIAEVCAKLKIPFYCVGYSADEGCVGQVNLRHYVTWGNKKSDRASLTKITYRYENRDGPCIRYITDMLTATRKEKNKLLIVISDGEPSAEQYRGQKAIEDTSKAIRSAKVKNKVCGVCIDKSSAETLRQLYEGNFVEVRNLNNLSTMLSAKLKSILREWA